MNSFKIKSYAKINLALNITGKKSKLHNIESLISFIDLHDSITLRESNTKQHKINFFGKFSKNISKINKILLINRVLIEIDVTTICFQDCDLRSILNSMLIASIKKQGYKNRAELLKVIKKTTFIDYVYQSFENVLDSKDNLEIKIQLPESYILHIGSFEKRKDLITLVKAFHVIKKHESNKKIKIVLAGAQVVNGNKKIIKQIKYY